MKKISLLFILALFLYLPTFAQNDELYPQYVVDHKIDNFNRLTADDLKQRLDSMRVELQSDPNAEGVVEIIFNKKDSRRKKIEWLKIFDRSFRFIKVDSFRYTFMISLSDEEETSLWIFSIQEVSNMENSKNKERIFIRGENLRKEINNIFKDNK